MIIKRCKRCGSMAINEQSHGREKGFKSDLCDVCYWRSEAEELAELLAETIKIRDEGK